MPAAYARLSRAEKRRLVPLASEEVKAGRPGEVAAAVVEDTLGLAEWWAKGRQINDRHREDVRQELALSLYGTLRRYRVVEGVDHAYRFSTAAGFGFLNVVKMEAERYVRHPEPLQLRPFEESCIPDRPHDEPVERSDYRKTVGHILDRLSPRHAVVIRARFGIDGPRETLSVIGDRLGITKERVRQIEKAAIRKLQTIIRQYPGLWPGEEEA